MDTNIIGDSGEYFAAGTLMIGELFRVVLIGGKQPAFDIYAEINDKSTPYPLLIQIKTTEQKDRYNIDSIKTKVEYAKVVWLADRPIPTYVGGYDLVNHTLYIEPAFDRTGHFPSIKIKHRIPTMRKRVATKELELLKNDVLAYWNGININTYKQSYKSLL